MRRGTFTFYFLSLFSRYLPSRNNPPLPREGSKDFLRSFGSRSAETWQESEIFAFRIKKKFNTWWIRGRPWQAGRNGRRTGLFRWWWRWGTEGKGIPVGLRETGGRSVETFLNLIFGFTLRFVASVIGSFGVICRCWGEKFRKDGFQFTTRTVLEHSATNQ